MPDYLTVYWLEFDETGAVCRSCRRRILETSNEERTDNNDDEDRRSKNDHFLQSLLGPLLVLLVSLFIYFVGQNQLLKYIRYKYKVAWAAPSS